MLHQVVLVLTVLLASPVVGQISEGGKPASFVVDSDLHKLPVPIFTLVPESLDKWIAEGEAESVNKSVPLRFGYPFSNVGINMKDSGSWTIIPNGEEKLRVWRVGIESPGAYSINLILDRFNLKEGGKLFLYNKERDMLIGAFTEKNNKPHGGLGIQPVKGDHIFLEYSEPVTGDDVQGEISIGSVIHAYRNFFGDQPQQKKCFGCSGSCNINVECAVGQEWKDQIRSVAMILSSGGFRLCSGSLINNLINDPAPYFLTAYHCLGGEENWIFMFNYQSPTCQGKQDGPTTNTVSGSTLRASGPTSDFALLELDESPNFDVYYSGFSAESTAATEAVGIHHPSGDVKKISFDDGPLVSSEWNAAPVGTHWKVTSWDDGTTEPGSSGSPIFDQNQRIVGQLHGGTASCYSQTYDLYGKVAWSWTSGLKDWLDPENSGSLVCDGRNGP
eukprot:CAMPEP_0174261638 /NCGR_PEP_ID=MMETSP0439-20130205/11683_1 /TAXON_ID=0 /ORGANISM="Stereomyxa ramosa, Strain Chinc5" /LENGTH=444 /DNA_ID=CAMNT_0015346145 /DNA_START=31 /DNA_END=1365 /DNA_ORIENTATION=-